MSEKAKVGRPTKYTEEMPEKLLEYFSRPMYEYIKEQRLTQKGDIVEVEVRVPCEPPIVEGFCAEQNIGKKTFYRWIAEHEEFRHAFDASKAHQTKKLVSHSMLGGYSASISKLILANCTDYKEDKEEVKQEIKVVLPDVRAKEL